MNHALLDQANELNQQVLADISMATFMRRIGDYTRMRDLMNSAMDKVQQADTALKAAFSTSETNGR